MGGGDVGVLGLIEHQATSVQGDSSNHGGPGLGFIEHQATTKTPGRLESGNRGGLGLIDH